MNYCPNCGEALSNRPKFCTNCGARLLPNDYETREPNVTRVYQEQPKPAVAYKLRSNRGLLKFIFLSILTFGIYGLVVMCNISEEINTVASKYDSRHTMHYLVAFLLLGPITFGIVPLVWTHRLCNRIGDNLSVRNIPYSFGAGTFWGWGVIGCLIVIGPFIYTHKLLTAMNLINQHYNVNG